VVAQLEKMSQNFGATYTYTCMKVVYIAVGLRRYVGTGTHYFMKESASS